MASALYENALAELGGQRDGWIARLAEIRSVDGPDRGNHSGARTAEQIEREEQLSEYPDRSHPGVMVEFLKALCTITCGTADKIEFAEKFEAVCAQFDRRGHRVLPAHRPRIVYRYLRSGEGFLESVAEALDKAGMREKARRLRRRIDVASNADAHATWELALELVRSPEYWNFLPRESLKLARTRSVFVTFDGPIPLDRSHARTVFEALALALPGPRSCFIEAKFELTETFTLHVPTVADAGWFRHFQGTPYGEPHGWTRPRGGESRQPEAIQLTPSLADLFLANDLRLVPP
jgi:hypothetical protein